MSRLPNSLEARDIAYHLHSYTDARKHEETGPLVIERGEGVHVYDNNGKRYIEGMAGLWSVALGFGEKRLAEAAARQMEKLPYYHTFAHKSHGPSVELAEKLVAMAPVPMSKAYFTNSGSEANDTAIKMIWYRANAMGEPQRKKIISRVKGYHGVTLASASLTGLPNNHRSFDLPLAGILHTTCPHYRTMKKEGESEAEFAKRCARDLEALIVEEGPETIAAFFAEPVMGAGGVIVPPEGYWEAIQPVLKKYGILFVADEVICGFGRTGELFGSTTYHLEPDIMTLSKQLSSSYLPISALLVNEKVYAPLADESHTIGTWGHGFTGSGHPVAAAVALENLKIMEERDVLGHVREIAPRFLARLQALGGHALAIEARGIGLIGAVEFTHPSLADTPGALGGRIYQAMQDRGLILRNLGDTLAFCPPLVISEKEIDEMFDIAEAALCDVAKGVE
ncbi:aspartate aminotransferase family protein [Chelativorans salis]|uniref:Aspartate aminotransferase family protein n=1 Tax=Chelativorans salis TaxID=2978478 RepID=A0ABT2LRH4_9HYPH|nr:aspartate aminotransferase family protein [Chelativorans sp. EGI FJ00035]MCT7377064.1 aspartate aminotransferase family protein [Chelativorans sp. EGI FJ00035]